MREDATRRRHGSMGLSTRYVALVLGVVIGTGLLLGVGVTLVSVRHAAAERQRSLEYAATVVAAATIPNIADEEREAISARMNAMIGDARIEDIECIAVMDAQGNVIAETENGCTCDLVEPNAGLIDVFTNAQRVEVPLEVDGLVVGSVLVQFRPVGLEEAVFGPLRMTALVLVLTTVVSGVWGGWMVLRSVVEPIGTLRDAASQIAEGRRDVRIVHERSDEIGELATALDDMTRQLQRQEQELLDSYRSLEVAFNDKAELARRLELTMGLKSDFVAVASHELRSPLAVIRLYAEMLDGNEYGDMDPELAEAVGSIVGAVARLSSIVQSLMDVALLERGLIPLEYADVPLGEVVERAVSDAAALARTADVDVVLVSAPPAVTLRGDVIRLRQAIDNLLSNAVKYSGTGGFVTVEMAADGDEVRIAVSDTGPGIPSERADVLFELFGRLDAEDNAEVTGLGLGLPIADRIARAHGGSIAFAPNPAGVGSVFTIRLPAGGVPEGQAPASIDVVRNEGAY